MRALLVSLAFVLLSACVPTLKQHALVAVVSSELIDEVGAAIESEAYGDWERVGGAHADFAELAALKAHWEPARDKYKQVVAVHKAYVHAVAGGAPEEVRRAASTLLRVWTQLDEVAHQLGLDAPPVPDVLRKLGGDQ